MRPACPQRRFKKRPCITTGGGEGRGGPVLTGGFQPPMGGGREKERKGRQEELLHEKKRVEKEKYVCLRKRKQGGKKMTSKKNKGREFSILRRGLRTEVYEEGGKKRSSRALGKRREALLPFCPQRKTATRAKGKRRGASPGNASELLDAIVRPGHKADRRNTPKTDPTWGPKRTFTVRKEKGKNINRKYSTREKKKESGARMSDNPRCAYLHEKRGNGEKKDRTPSLILQ